MSSTRRYDLLRSRLDRFTRTLHGVESGEVGAVHRVRVASRRLRELLPVLEIEQALARKLVRRLRKLTRRLGGVRDLDVPSHPLESYDVLTRSDPDDAA